MKKKLNLNRETIRNLDPSDLGNVHGGTNTGDPCRVTCPTECMVTECCHTVECESNVACLATNMAC